MATLAKTGGFKSSGNADSEQITHSVDYKLISDYRMSIGDAWLESWNRLKFSTHLGCELVSVDVSGEVENDGRVFYVTANYEWTKEETLWATISFSTRGGREKKIHSHSTVSYKATNAKIEPPDFKNAIGYNNGVFDGVDIVTPQFGFSLDVDLPERYFTPAQFSYFHSLTGKTNAQPFWIFRPEECLFTGLNGNSYRKKVGSEYQLWYKLSFEFEAMPSLYGASIPPFENVNKPGMHYLWVMHQDAKCETSEVTVPLPVALYVEKVYETADFNWFHNLQW